MENKGYDYLILISIKEDRLEYCDIDYEVEVAIWPQFTGVIIEDISLLRKESDMMFHEELCVVIRHECPLGYTFPAGNYELRMHSEWSEEEKRERIKNLILSNLKPVEEYNRIIGKIF